LKKRISLLILALLLFNLVGCDEKKVEQSSEGKKQNIQENKQSNAETSKWKKQICQSLNQFLLILQRNIILNNTLQ